MIKMPKIRVTQIIMAATIVVFSFIRPLQMYTFLFAWGLKRFIDYVVDMRSPEEGVSDK